MQKKSGFTTALAYDKYSTTKKACVRVDSAEPAGDFGSASRSHRQSPFPMWVVDGYVPAFTRVAEAWPRLRVEAWVSKSLDMWRGAHYGSIFAFRFLKRTCLKILKSVRVFTQLQKSLSLLHGKMNYENELF
jgi:hypothetical protein